MHPHDARILANDLLQRHGLTDAGWKFAFDHARRRFGCCNVTRKFVTLSRPLTLLNDDPQVRDTLLHEIAHALTPGDGHGRLWKAMCLRIGARPARCYTDATVVSPPRSAPRYEYGCNPCGWWVERRRLAANRFVCKHCCGTLLYRDKSTGQLLKVAPVRGGRTVTPVG